MDWIDADVDASFVETGDSVVDVRLLHLKEFVNVLFHPMSV